MSEITASSMEDVLLGTQRVGALMSGTREIYVRLEKYSYDTPSTYTITLPDWASAYGVLLSGGGGGGQAGSNADSTNGRGGRGGGLRMVRGVMNSDSSRVIKVTVGAGGAGGASPREYGQDGGQTTITTHTSNVYSASGGTGNPTSSSQNGGESIITFSETFAEYVNLPPQSSYTNGPRGTGNGGSGKRGGGGAGGNGGYIGNYTKGGKGGDGFADIYIWGLPRHGLEGVVQITLGTGTEARDQLRDALSARGLNYATVEEIPFDIELVGTGSAQQMFYNCQALTKAPPMDTMNVTNMKEMFWNCSSLTHVPQIVTFGATDMSRMFLNCSSLTDETVHLTPPMDINSVNVSDMIANSGLTRIPFYTEVVKIPKATGGTTTARDAFRDALAARGFDYKTITHLPFEIELTGSGDSVLDLFADCEKLKTVPTIPLFGVTNTQGMFVRCTSLTSVGVLGMHDVTNAKYMFWGCTSLTDGNVILSGKNPNVDDEYMILDSGLTKKPWYTG